MRQIGAGLLEPWVRTFAVLLLTQLVSELAFQFALPFLPLYLLELGVPDEAQVGIWAGVMSASFATVMAIMAPIWGLVADRFSRRAMIQRAIIGAGITIGGLAFVQTPEQMLVLRVIQGSLTGVVAAMAVVVSLTVPRAHLATALGLMQAAQLGGSALGPIVGGVFADTFGLRQAFLVTSLIFAVTGLLVTLFVAEPPRVAAAKPAGGVAAPAEAGIPRRELMVAIAVMATIRIAMNAPAPVLPLFIHRLAGPGVAVATTVGVVLAATGIASAISSVALGRVTDRFGARWTLALCLVAAIALSPLHWPVATVGQLLVIRTAMGFALGGMVPAVQTLITDRTPPNRRGAIFGLLATAQAIGNGGGPVMGALVAASYDVPMVFIAAIPVFAFGLMLVLRLPPKEQPAVA